MQTRRSVRTVAQVESRLRAILHAPIVLQGTSKMLLARRRARLAWPDSIQIQGRAFAPAAWQGSINRVLANRAARHVVKDSIQA